MSQAPASVNWGDVFSPIGERIGKAAGDYAAGWLGRQIGNAPTSFGAGVLQSEIEDTIARIEDLTKQLQERSAFYRNLGERETKELGKISGKNIANYRESSLKKFNRGVARERERGTEYLTSYDPNILGSPAAQRMQMALASATGGFAEGLGDISAIGSQRFLESAADLPVAAFKGIANDRDYNLLLNPTYMSQATSPQTVSMDLNKYTPYMTYNV